MNWEMAVLFLPGLMIGLTCHECAHAWSASLLGDDFARRQGRVSLNPFRHLSLLGTLAIFILPIGWAKPVPVNLYNFKHPRRDYLITSLAGPAANLLIVVACVVAMLFTRHCYRYEAIAPWLMHLAHALLGLTAMINTILAAINLLPIPPLDGSKIWPCLAPWVKPAFKPKTTWFFIVVLLVLMQTRALSPLIGGAIGGLGRILPISDEALVAEHCIAGDAAFEAERYADAEAHFTDALAIHPRSAVNLAWRADTRLHRGDFDGALADINAAIDESNAKAEYYNIRADIYDGLGREADAKADRLAAVALLLKEAPVDVTGDAVSPRSTSRPAGVDR